MKTYFLDTNILARGFLKDIKAQYVQISKLFKDAKNKEVKLVLIPEIVIELNFLLSKIYHIPKPKIINYIFELIETPFIDIRNRLLLREALFIYRNNEMSFVDCWIFTQAKAENASVFSFDKDFKKIK